MTSFWLFWKNKDCISFLLFVVACSNWLPSSKSITANRRLVSIPVYEKCCFFGVHLLYNTSSTPIWQSSPNNLDLLKHSYTERSFAMPQKLLILAIPILFFSLACWSRMSKSRLLISTCPRLLVLYVKKIPFFTQNIRTCIPSHVPYVHQKWFPINFIHLSIIPTWGCFAISK